MKITLDKDTKTKLKQVAKDEGRGLKKHIETILRYSVEEVELLKQPVGFRNV